MRYSIYLIIYLFSFESISQNKINWFELDSNTKINNNGKKIIIDLYTDWCGWCKVMDRNTFTDDDVINLIKDRTLFILLHDNPINIKNRINNIDTRGIIGMENNSFEEIFYQRQGLYQNVCDLRFNLEFQSFKSVCNNIISYLDLLI